MVYESRVDFSGTGVYAKKAAQGMLACVCACVCMFACPLSEQVPKRMVGSNQGFLKTILPGLPLEDGVLFRGLNILVYFIASCPPNPNRNSTLENLNFDKESNNFLEWFLNLFTHFNEHLGTLIQ